MIFQRALRRELLATAGATFTVLFSILVSWTLMKILGEAAGGKVAPNDVVALIAFAALNYLPTVIILTSFISVLAVITRIYRDSEMVVWFASGQSLTGFIRPVLQFGLPLVVLTAVLSLVVQPWAKQKNDEYIERFEKREDLQKVSPGQFRESAGANRIFFVEGVTGDSTIVQNVFVNTAEANGTTVVVAKEGVIEEGANGMRYLVLKNGRRYQGMPGQADFQSMEFERYSMRVASKAPVTGVEHTAEALPTPALLAERNRYNDAELLWRVALPITCLLLVMLAIPLGFVNPRAGSSANLVIALLIFFSYNNLNKMMESSVRQEKLSLVMAWWPMHLAAALLVIGLFVLRLNVNHRYHPLAIYARFKRGRMETGAAA